MTRPVASYCRNFPSDCLKLTFPEKVFKVWKFNLRPKNWFQLIFFFFFGKQERKTFVSRFSIRLFHAWLILALVLIRKREVFPRFPSLDVVLVISVQTEVLIIYIRHLSFTLSHIVKKVTRTNLMIDQLFNVC
jgi:hypothetical protein